MTPLPLVSPLDRILFLKAQPYLAEQPPEVLTVLAYYTEERHYRGGQPVREAGDRVDRISFLAQGHVDVGGRDDAEAARRIGAPGVVGLVHHFAGVERPPAVRAGADTLCLELRVGDLDQILEDHFSLLLGFARRTGDEALRAGRALGSARPDEPGFDEATRSGTPVQLDIVHRLAQARRAPWFRGTNLTVLGQLTRFETIERLAPGQALWKTGDPIDRMALVVDGSFESDGPFARCRAREGALVGALEILSEAPRLEGWVARTPSRVLTIRRDLFVDLLEDQHDFAREYLGRCSERAIAAWAGTEAPS